MKEPRKYVFDPKRYSTHEAAVSVMASDMEELDGYEWKRVYTKKEREAIARTILRFRCGSITGDCGTLNWSRTSDAEPIYWLEK